MKRALAAYVAALVVLLPTVAEARHHRPPAAKLVAGDTTQWGKLLTHCWSSIEGDEGTGFCADAAGYDWPHSKDADSGTRTRIRFKIAGCPNEVVLRWWAAVDDEEQPVGEGRDLSFRKKRVRKGGDVVACRVWFRLPDQEGDFYLEAWTDWDRMYRFPDGGRGGGGDAQYTFRLSLEPAPGP